MNLTKHAEQRALQRGIPQFVVDCLLEYGEVEFHNGCEIRRMTKKAEKRLRGYMGRLAGDVSKVLRDVYVVTSADTVLTVARQTRHLKRDR